eukprot:CAMPEP_0168426610 /NCGR_PEP_ID=MMETSP0228-20121227/35924_1 /TAXON_ID=133427 /ORGANISM="Protoceratium reticulatum, Strain CCCM 535 (=CCMP 1889)" /LENGTH=211 /DNA_ID=CAMNT_0008440631 /DNA_START=27 /DNA_END=661 /DNA_ORIENTATION=-
MTGHALGAQGRSSVVPVSVVLQRDVLARVAPLVGAAVAELMREVVVVEVDPIAVAVKVLEVLLAVHPDLHGLAPLLEPRYEEDAEDGDAHHVQLRAGGEQVVDEAPCVLLEGDGLEAVLGVEVLVGVDRGVVNATDHPWWPVQRAHNGVLEAEDGVGASHPAVGAHLLLALQREVGADKLEAVLSVEVLVGINGGVVDATDNPWWPVQCAH